MNRRHVDTILLKVPKPISTMINYSGTRCSKQLGLCCVACLFSRSALWLTSGFAFRAACLCSRNALLNKWGFVSRGICFKANTGFISRDMFVRGNTLIHNMGVNLERHLFSSPKRWLTTWGTISCGMLRRETNSGEHNWVFILHGMCCFRKHAGQQHWGLYRAVFSVG